MRAAVALACAVVVLQLCSGAHATLNKYVFSAAESAEYGARCLDGSPSGYYYEAATSPAAADVWVVFLQGGGECHTQSTCAARAKTVLGTSTLWPATFADTTNVLSNSAAVNPDFAGAHHVYIPYCGGDVHTGTRTAPYEDWGLYFAGHLTFSGVLQHLSATYGFDSAQHVLLSGSSAGGIGAFNNADFLSAYLPKAVVKASPQAGWFFPEVVPFPEWVLNMSSTLNSTLETMAHTWQSALDADCVQHNPGNTVACITLNALYPWVHTPKFVAEYMYDSNQIFTQLKCPELNVSVARDYVRYYGQTMRASIAQVLHNPDVSGDGLYMASCLDHTEGLNLAQAPTVQGTTYAKALGDWFWGRDNGVSPRVIDDCGDMPCNPQCPPM